MDSINPSQRAMGGYPADGRWMFYQANTFRPYLSVQEANDTIPVEKRHKGLFVNINNDLYWYKNGIDPILFLPGTQAVADIAVFKEHLEWVTSSTSPNIDFGSTLNPRNGLTNIYASAFTEGDTIKFTPAQVQDLAGIKSLQFFVMLHAGFDSATKFTVQFYNETAGVSTTVAIGSGAYGFDRNLAHTWQQITIPIVDFLLPAPAVTSLNIRMVGASAAGFQLDDILLVGGAAVVYNWGVIGGNMAEQLDLSAAMVKKADLVGGKVPVAQLPSYVDEVLEFASLSAFPATGGGTKIYLAQDSNITYRWSGSAYIQIGGNVSNFANTNLTFTGPRSHNAAGFGMNLENLQSVSFNLNDGAGARSNITMTGSGMVLSHLVQLLINAPSIVLNGLTNNEGLNKILAIDDSGKVQYRSALELKGATGGQGIQGESSLVPGPIGPQGPPGPQGQASTVPGPQGPPGDAGSSGVNSWSTTGNYTNTLNTSSFLGTVEDMPFDIRTNSQTRIFVSNEGFIALSKGVTVQDLQNPLGSGASPYTPEPSALLRLNSTSQGVLFPSMTTLQKNAIAAPVTGLVLFDTDLNKLNIYNGAEWQNIIQSP